MSKPAATRLLPEVRVGANADALSPISSASRSVSPNAAAWLLFALVAGTTFAADRFSKDAVDDRFAYGADHPLLGPLSLTHTTNSGIAFGLFPTRTSLVALVGLSAVAAMVVFFGRVGGDDARLAPAFGLLAGGTLGNLLDRLRFGRVTDFVELRFWPAFNLADVFIVTGVVLLMLILLVGGKPAAPTRPPNQLEAR